MAGMFVEGALFEVAGQEFETGAAFKWSSAMLNKLPGIRFLQSPRYQRLYDTFVKNPSSFK